MRNGALQSPIRDLRKDLRNFRVERITASRMLAARFQDHNGRLLSQWQALPKERAVPRP